MFDTVDIAFGYERESKVCLYLQDFSNGKGGSLQVICDAHTPFITLWGRIDCFGHVPYRYLQVFSKVLNNMCKVSKMFPPLSKALHLQIPIRNTNIENILRQDGLITISWYRTQTFLQPPAIMTRATAFKSAYPRGPLVFQVVYHPRKRTFKTHNKHVFFRYFFLKFETITKTTHQSDVGLFCTP